MKYWQHMLGAAVLGMALSHAGIAQAQLRNDPAPGAAAFNDPAAVQKATRTFKSPDGKHALRVDETMTTIQRHADGVPGTFVGKSVATQVTGLAIAADGKTAEQWQWSEPSDVNLRFQVADALVSNSGKLHVMIGRYKARPVVAKERVIVILDDQGKVHAQVTAQDWVDAFGTDVDIVDNQPQLRLLETEKTLEITLKSGAAARVNTDSGKLTAVTRTATAPTPAKQNP